MINKKSAAGLIATAAGVGALALPGYAQAGIVSRCGHNGSYIHSITLCLEVETVNNTNVTRISVFPTRFDAPNHYPTDPVTFLIRRFNKSGRIDKTWGWLTARSGHPAPRIDVCRGNTPPCGLYGDGTHSLDAQVDLAGPSNWFDTPDILIGGGGIK